MIDINTLFVIVYLGIGVTILFLCLPLLYNKIKMNYWYGFRISQSFTSEENWFAINQFGAKRFLRWNSVFFIIAFVTLVLPFETIPWLTIIIGFLPVVILLFPLVEILLFAKNL